MRFIWIFHYFFGGKCNYKIFSSRPLTLHIYLYVTKIMEKGRESILPIIFFMKLVCSGCEGGQGCEGGEGWIYFCCAAERPIRKQLHWCWVINHPDTASLTATNTKHTRLRLLHWYSAIKSSTPVLNRLIWYNNIVLNLSFYGAPHPSYPDCAHRSIS